MCGIVGYAGNQQALPILLEGLRRLEYRGYDSAGVAVLDGGAVQVVRKAGKLEALEQALGSRRRPGRGERDRAHPVGDPRAADRPQRPPPPGLLGAGGGDPQRDHRELLHPAGPAGGRGPPVRLPDRHRVCRPPGRGRPGPGAGVPGRGAHGAEAARGVVRAGRAPPGRPGGGGRGQARPAPGGREGRRGELRGQRLRRLPRPHQGRGDPGGRPGRGRDPRAAWT